MPVSSEIPSRGLAVVLVAALVASALLALNSGATPASLWGLYASPEQDARALARDRAILLELRLPRVVASLVVGAATAVSGAVLQGLFRNALADPALLGIMSGAALGAGVVLLGAGQWGGLEVRLLGQIGAIAGAAAAFFLVWSLACRFAADRTQGLLLAGIAVKAAASAGTGLLTFLYSDSQLRTFVFWTLGGMGGVERAALPFLLAPTGIALWIALRQARALDCLALGEQTAFHLGVDLARTRRLLVGGSLLAVGASVAIVGPISFVGLVVPHVLRLTGAVRHARLLPLCALFGALAVLWADLLARILVRPQELPLGLVTAAFGAPTFAYLLWRRGKQA